MDAAKERMQERLAIYANSGGNTGTLQKMKTKATGIFTPDRPSTSADPQTSGTSAEDPPADTLPAERARLSVDRDLTEPETIQRPITQIF